MATALVAAPREGLMEEGRTFYKISGSGNDFIFFDLSEEPAAGLDSPETIRRLCARGTGIGADGVVFIRPGTDDSFSMRYFNSDGSLGELCGNATLCALRFANEIGLVSAENVSIATDAGMVRARMREDLPEVDLAPVTEVAPQLDSVGRLDREERLGFVRAGVPHVVIIDQDVATADILGRGSRIRRDPALRDGANVNFLSGKPGGWTIRTYERGVEGETLACGTGAVASAILLVEWGRDSSPVRLETRSGKQLEVRLRREGSAWRPSLRGSADLIFTGQLRDLQPD